METKTLQARHSQEQHLQARHLQVIEKTPSTIITIFSESAQVCHLLHFDPKEQSALEVRLPQSVVPNSLVALNLRTNQTASFDYDEGTSLAQLINGPLKPRGKVTNRTGTWEGTLLNMQGDNNVTVMVPDSRETVFVNQATSITLATDDPLSLNPMVIFRAHGGALELSFLMTQMSWRATTTALLRNKGSRMLLRVAAQIRNDSGMNLTGQVSLIAGQASQPQASYDYPRVAMAAAPQAYRRSAVAVQQESDDVDMPTQVEDYQSFDIGERYLQDTLVIAELFQQEVNVKKIYLHEMQGSTTRVAYQFETPRFMHE